MERRFAVADPEQQRSSTRKTRAVPSVRDDAEVAGSLMARRRHHMQSPKTVYLLGAGAWHGYEGSRTKVRPPLAGNFFSAFYRLLISQDLEVKIGFITNYLADITGIDRPSQRTEFLGGQLKTGHSWTLQNRPPAMPLSETG